MEIDEKVLLPDHKTILFKQCHTLLNITLPSLRNIHTLVLHVDQCLMILNGLIDLVRKQF